MQISQNLAISKIKPLEIQNIIKRNKREIISNINTNINSNYTKYNINILGNTSETILNKIDNQNKKALNKRLQKNTNIAFSIISSIDIHDNYKTFYVDYLKELSNSNQQQQQLLMEKWALQQVVYLEKIYFNYELISAELHLDERNPHVHIVFSALNKATLKYNLKEEFNRTYQVIRNNNKKFIKKFCDENKITYIKNNKTISKDDLRTIKVFKEKYKEISLDEKWVKATNVKESLEEQISILQKQHKEYCEFIQLVNIKLEEENK